MGILQPIDFIIFFASLLGVMALGLWAGRKEDNSEDYYLAGRSTRWWGVAGSIFGSNISANHLVGMMGVGFALGFVESHFEISAIAGLLLLCYGFLPMYRKLRVYTLSEYLSRRYGDSSRVAYAVIMVVIIVFVMMVPAFYIGSRTVNILLVDQAEIQAVVDSGGAQKVEVDQGYYNLGILIMALVTGTYTIVGGLKAVIVTDVIQSLLMLLAAIIVCIFTFSQPEIGGWANLREMDSGGQGKDLVKLYLPSDHPKRPWTGMLSGLMILHFYYWGTNQFIVQRALAAKSDREARIGIITAGFFKLLIPFISIGTGIAAFYLFKQKMPGVTLDGDTAFPMLMREVISPAMAGLVGLVAAGLIGAILSSVDSMMNSASTILTFDIYKRYINPEASEKNLVFVGRAIIAGLVVLSAFLTIVIMDPNTKENFFNYVASHQSRLVAGLVVAFGMGMLWKRGTAAAGVTAIIAGVVFSYVLPPVYENTLGADPAWSAMFGTQLNFFHSVAVAAVLTLIVYVVVSLCTKPDAEKSQLTWTGLGGRTIGEMQHVIIAIVASLAVYGLIALLIVPGGLPVPGSPQETGILPPIIGALLAAGWTWALFLRSAWTNMKREGVAELSASTLVKEDRFWGGLLAACAIYMLFYFV